MVLALGQEMGNQGLEGYEEAVLQLVAAIIEEAEGIAPENVARVRTRDVVPATDFRSRTGIEAPE